MMTFWNRSKELELIKKRLRKGGFGYVTGRRRIGKTALLKKACEKFGGIYHQAVEGTPAQQILHLAEELAAKLGVFREITPKTWSEFFSLLAREKLPGLVVFDEFPYWVEGDHTLASVLQKWIDHELPKKRTLILISGSSQSMLYDQMLNRSLPLYGRASFHLHLEPMSYGWFCRTLGFKVAKPESFARFSLVGGVPYYWKLMPKGSMVDQAHELYFEPSAILSQEPASWIRDEGITGSLPKAILDLIGRGVAKPSELAARLGTPQGNLSRPLALLVELGLVSRELPFGESTRSTKRTHYAILDPALSFYFSTFLPHRSRWDALSKRKKGELLEMHASRQWEVFCRRSFRGSSRYWESGVEIDLVAATGEKGHYLVAECKWSQLTESAKRSMLADLKARFLKTRLGRRAHSAQFKILSKDDLPWLARNAQFANKG
ncbi:ATP-binding protein [Elusimicrobiota bacterium]